MTRLAIGAALVMAGLLVATIVGGIVWSSLPS
jgi:hypothetical protein